MSFAVVLFKDESQYSEVPVKWLTQCQSKCAWPPNNPKNLTSLIKNAVEPAADWVFFEVEVEGIFSTLEKARKKASDKDYTSNEDDRGRGKRRRFCADTSSSSDEELPRAGNMTPPKFALVNELCAEQPGLLPNQANNNFKGSIIYRNVSQESTNSGPNDGSLMINQVEEENVADYTVVSSEEHTISEESKSGDHTFDEESKIDKLLRMTSTIMYQIVDLNKKFDDLEMRSNPQKWKFFQQNLPCRSLADVEKVDRYLEDMEHKLEFTKCLHSIGGMHAKDRVNRIMKTLFSNQFGTSCSWLGQRSNLKASGFNFMQIARDSSASTMQLAEFEKYASEWLRLSRLRLSREKK